jgi:antitoxin (DNA-binding transcriptional repressor) of toxin-antitoxin stability system
LCWTAGKTRVLGDERSSKARLAVAGGAPKVDKDRQISYLWLANEKAMETITIHAAKTRLSQLLARVEAGEEIVLARGKHPIAKLVPFVPAPATRQFGALRGTVTVGPEFFEPLPAEELAAWE